MIEFAARALLVWTGAEGAEIVFTRLATGETKTPTVSDVEVSEAIQGELMRMSADGLAVKRIADCVADDVRLPMSTRTAARSIAEFLPPLQS